MRIQKKILFIILFFACFVVFNNSDCFAVSESKSNIPSDTPFYDYWYDRLTDNRNYLVIYYQDVYGGEFVSTFACVGSYNNRNVVHCIAFDSSNNTMYNNVNDDPRVYEPSSSFFNGATTTTNKYSIYRLEDNSLTHLYTNNNGRNTSSNVNLQSIKIIYSTDNVYSIDINQGTYFELNDFYNSEPEIDKLNLFELNLTDLDYNNTVHKFNIATYTDSPCYDEIMEYYNKDYQYAIFVTDYQRMLDYDNETNKNLQHSSYLLSGYVDFLIDDDAVFFYTDKILGNNTDITGIHTGINKGETIDCSVNVKKYLKRFYFKYVYSEDSYNTIDDYVQIWQNNGNLISIDDYNNVDYLCFVGSSQSIYFANATRSWSPIGGSKISSAVPTSQLYYIGYNDPMTHTLKGENSTRNVSYVFNFSLEGGTTHIFYMDNPNYENDKLDTIANMSLEYGKVTLPTDSSNGGIIIHGTDSSSSTFDYSDIDTRDDSLDLNNQENGSRSSSDSVEDTSNWGIIDYLKNIYQKLKDLLDGIVSLFSKTDTTADENNIKNNLNNVKDKIDFSSNVVNNINDLKSTIENTQSTSQVTLNLSGKYWNGNAVVLDLSWYEPYRESVDAIICTFAYLMFLWNFFIKLPDIIRGAGAGSYSPAMVENIKAYKATGFGRSSNIKKGGF